MCPQALRLSPEYSHKAGLQTDITEEPLQIGPVIHSAARGLLQWAEFHVGLRVGRGRGAGATSSKAFVLQRSGRRVEPAGRFASVGAARLAKASSEG
jgi:hypothetical protein